MSSATIFIIGIVLVLLISIGAKFGFNYKKARDYFVNDDHGKDAWPGIVLFLSIAGILVAIVSTIFGQKAEAGEGQWLSSGSIEVAMERPFSGASIFCEPGGIDDKITAYGALTINAYERDGFSVFLRAESHRSCAFSKDKEELNYSGFGFRYEFDIPWFNR